MEEMMNRNQQAKYEARAKVIDGEVKMVGRLASPEEIKQLLG